jgi:flavodoxin
MYRGVIIYAPAGGLMERLVRRVADGFDDKQFEVASHSADQAAIPDLTGADVFLLASLPTGQQPIHPDFAEILRALKGITLAGKVGGALSIDSEPTVSAFRQALRDCELVLPDQNFLTLSSEQVESADLSGWVDALIGQLGDQARGR